MGGNQGGEARGRGVLLPESGEQSTAGDRPAPRAFPAQRPWTVWPQSWAERSERELEPANSQLLAHVGGEVIRESQGATTQSGAGGDARVWNSCHGEGDWEPTGAKYRAAELRLEGRRALPCLVNSLCSIQGSLHLLSAVGRQKQEAGGGVTQG